MGQATVGTSISIVDIFSIISSVFSIVLGIVAIYLSIVFFKMSDKTSKEAEKSASNIDSSVKKLEMLFEKLYSGTFDMMKETVTDMRKHVYSKNNNFDENNEKINNEIAEKVLNEVSSSVNELKNNQKSEEDIKKLIVDIIEKSQQTEKDLKNNKIRDEIISLLRVKGEVTFTEMELYLINKGISSKKDESLFSELEKLADEGITNDPFKFNEDIGKHIYHDAIVYLV